MAEPTAALLVRIGADAKQLLSELGMAEKRLSGTEKAFNMATKAAKVFAASAATLGAAVAALVNRQASLADQAVKTASKLGVTVEALTELRYAAELSGVKVQTFDMALQRFGRRAAEAAQGTGEAKNALEELGIKLTDGNGVLRSSDELLGDVADAMKGVATDGDRLRLAFKLFDSEGVAMVNMLRDGKAGLMSMREEARLLGASIDSEAGRAAVEFKDNLTRLGAVQTGLANTLMSELLPSLNAATGAMAEATIKSGGFREEMKTVADVLKGSAITSFQTLAVLGSDVAFVFKMIGGEIGVWAAQLAALGRGDFAGFSLIGEEWRRDSEQARKDLDDFQSRVMKIGETIQSVREGKGGAGGAPAAPPPSAGGDRKGNGAVGDTARQLAEEAALQMKAWEDELRMEETFRRTAQEFEEEEFERRLNAIREHLEEERRLRQEAVADEIRIAQEKADREWRLQQETQQRQIEARRRFVDNLAGLMNTSSKKAFEFGKKVSIAQAAVKGAQAVMDAWQAGMSTGGPWAPVIAAGYAAAAAVNAANIIQNIRSQEFGGGGGTPVAPSQGSSGVSPVGAGGGQQQARGPDNIIHLHGESFSAKQLREMFDRLNEGQRDGGRFVIA